MYLSFTKYQNCGNDFVILDGKDRFLLDKNTFFFEKICDRRKGIGADGVIFLRESKSTDYMMEYFNSDGSKGFCGNGSRSLFDYASKKMNLKKIACFEACDGIHQIYRQKNLIFTSFFDIDLSEVKSELIDTGCPHHVKFVKNLQEVDVVRAGSEIRFSKKYEKINGVNVDFCEKVKGYIRMRTYERGVEDETLSCGTGAVAAAIFAHKVFGSLSPVRVATPGGNLYVKFEKKGDWITDLWLGGEAKKVFEGTIEI